MDRIAAFATLASLGLGPVMLVAGRTLDDTATGYGPALDEAFAAYGAMTGATTIPSVVATAHQIGFRVLMRATVYDLVLPAFSALVDASIDAPLTNAKWSQAYRQLAAQSELAWQKAMGYGYGPLLGASGFRVNLDFLEPGRGSSAEYQ